MSGKQQIDAIMLWFMTSAPQTEGTVLIICNGIATDLPLQNLGPFHIYFCKNSML